MLQDDNQAMWSVTVPKEGETEWGISKKLFDFPFYIQDPGWEIGCYDVAPDGRFIFSKSVHELNEPQTYPRDIRVVLNAFAEIKRLAPSGK